MHPAHTLFNCRQVLRAEHAQLFTNAGFADGADLVAQGHGAGFACTGHGHDERGQCARGRGEGHQSVYDRGTTQIIEALKLLMAQERLVLQDAETVGLALAEFQLKPALGFSDCLVLEIARKAGHMPLEPFDRALARLEGAQKL